MRKTLIALLLAVSFGALAQKDDCTKDAQDNLSKGKYAEAKDKIDKAISDSKCSGSAATWYWKGKIYTELARTDSTGKLTYDAAGEAFQAFKKYQEMDPKNIMMTLDQNIGLFAIYEIYYNQGVNKFNAKDYPLAFEKMKNALDVENYINKKGFTYKNNAGKDVLLPALDTNLVRLTANSAYLAKKEDDAIPYFEKLADAKINEKDFKDIYALLVQYNNKKGNTAKADKYLAIGKELYPDEDYWLGVEFGTVGNDKAAIMKRYEEMLQKYPNNAVLNLEYATELRNYAYVFDQKPADYTARQAKYDAALSKAISLNPNSALAYYLQSEHLEFQLYDLQDALRDVKGNTPADAAKRRDFNAKINQKYDEMAAASQKALDLYSKETGLKLQDKANERKVINRLIDYYTRKKDTQKVTFYQDKLKTI